MKKKLKNIRLRRSKKTDIDEKPKRITTENLAEHREEVLGKARKYKYPLRHSKHRLVIISLSIFIVAVISFFSYAIIALYKAKSSSDFIYQVTKVIPFPIARIGSDFISYEDYLFEVKHYIYYYQHQQGVDFNSSSGKDQLADFKKRAYNSVINDAYVRKIAKEKGISVSNQELEDEIRTYRSQNRLGASDDEFKTVLHDFWNWSVDDFKRSLKQQLLNEKVVAALDSDANNKAQSALSQLKAGEDFGKLAKKVSEDPSTKDREGDFGYLIDRNNRDISPKTSDALFKLKPGEYSDIINIGYGLEIVKNVEQKGDKIKAAHIVFNFKDLNEYLGAYKDQHKVRAYVTF